MDYQKKSFSVRVGSQKYSENWERIFGKKDFLDEVVEERTKKNPDFPQLLDKKISERKRPSKKSRK
jgi:hypothetical protein